MVKRAQGWSFFSMGLCSTAAQGLLVRLLLSTFSGNELSIGLLLGGWMLGGALGSHLGGRLRNTERQPASMLVMSQVLFALLLPLVVAGCYLVRRAVGAAPGQALGLATIACASFVLTFPLGFLQGLMFGLASTSLAGATQGNAGGAGQLYALEALGGLIGGGTLTFVLTPHLKPLQSVLLLSIVSLIASGMWMLTLRHHPRYWIAAVALSGTLAVYLMLPSQALRLHRLLSRQRWGEAYNIVYERDSPYANIVVTQLHGQYTLWSNGVVMLTAPEPDVATVEEIAHLPPLFHPHPQRMLVIGGGVGGVLAELLKYDPEQIDYAQPDSGILDAIAAFPTAWTRDQLTDVRVRVQRVDGRLLLKRMALAHQSSFRYDLVLVNLPYPSTLELNRFYTVEFFRLIEAVLDHRGLAVFTLPGSLTYLGAGMRDLHACMQAGLQAVFPNVRPIPGDTTLWLASPSLNLTATTTDQLVASWQQQAIPSLALSEQELGTVFDARRLAWFEGTLQGAPHLFTNLDFRPVAVLYSLSYWSEIFGPASSRFLIAVRRLTLGHWSILAVVATIFLGILARRRGQAKHLTIRTVVAITGFSGTACDLIIVFVFQTLYGCAYQYIGLIIAVFMAGLALGSCTATGRKNLPNSAHRTIVLTELALAAFWLILPLWFNVVHQSGSIPFFILSLLVPNTVGGWLVGTQFGWLSGLRTDSSDLPTYPGSLLYASDLLGACLGALVVGTALLPVLGTTGTCLFLVVLKGCSLGLWLTSGRP